MRPARRCRLSFCGRGCGALTKVLPSPLQTVLLISPHAAASPRSRVAESSVPHSRHTTCRREDIEAVPKLKILASSEEAGVFVCATEKGRQIFVTGHSEYDADTLKNEYFRDKNAGLPIDLPKNYFPDDDDTKEPIVRWRSCANLF